MCCCSLISVIPSHIIHQSHITSHHISKLSSQFLPLLGEETKFEQVLKAKSYRLQKLCLLAHIT